MKKLMLTSAGFENPEIGKRFLQMCDKAAPNAKVLFIPTAASNEIELQYVKKSEEELLAAGIRKENIIYYNMEYHMSYEELKTIDVLYVCGGTMERLLSKVKEVEFDLLLERYINEGRLYIGVSAGSILLCPEYKNLICLNIIKPIIVPHYSEDNYELKQYVDMLKEQGRSDFVALTDRQALLIEDDRWSIFE